ncbi:DNA-binding response regulator [Paenibacillus sp. 1011MAR3C5]|uniref:response regulator n=1 Tax=Paenibacillus sp. 1011MAR3C5 TaxID=1675787 RepID=UPI000E6B8F2D|nr:response regulator transcription factor [Paenibacillus sp. 1011MAR3C5]RJE90273.1 DNA-binding response regulator [Paenibacillus sp. 1011MAR3C5]
MKLLIVDDDPLVCQSLQLLLGKEEDFEVIGVALNGQEAIQLCHLQPDVILMDIQMPIMDGIESTKIIKQQYPFILVMMLTTFQDERNIRLALQAGAEGYLLKSSTVEKMAENIRAITSGATVLSPDVLKTIMEPSRESLQGLTERESDIVELVSQGLSNKEISEQLYLSVGTVRNMLTIILDKLELRDRTQLAIYYWQRKSQLGK